MITQQQDVFYKLGYPKIHILKHKTNYFQNKDMRHWSTNVKKFYLNSCALTGLNHGPGCYLVCHHLYSKHSYKSLEKNFLNGILLEKSLHDHYHKKIGKNPENVTIASFKDFIKYLSQFKGMCLTFEGGDFNFLTDDGFLLNQNLKKLDTSNVVTDILFIEKMFEKEKPLFVPFSLKRFSLLLNYLTLLEEHIKNDYLVD